MPSTGRFPVRRRWDRFARNRVRPTLQPVGGCRSPDRSPFISGQPAYDATHDYFLPAFRGTSYRSPIGHCPARLFKSSTGKNRQNFKSGHLSELLREKHAGTGGLRSPPRWGLKQNLMGAADCEPTFGLVPGRPRRVYLQGGLSLPPELGPFLSSGRYRVLAELGHSPFQNSWLLKLSLMVSADCEATSASHSV
jgi:hypothetical protein